MTGQHEAGPDDVRHLSWLLRYMGKALFGTSGSDRVPSARRSVPEPVRFAGVRSERDFGPDVRRVGGAGRVRDAVRVTRSYAVDRPPPSVARPDGRRRPRAA